jgi:hypothetical protein
MQIFIMHVGRPGNVDIDWTVTQHRNLDEVLSKLPHGAVERSYFEADPKLHEAYPDGRFNCWGVPNNAEPSFRRTRVGDVVLMIPSIGVDDGGIRQLGVVDAICPHRAWEASRILWPKTPHERLFPFIFFFRTEVGYRSWPDFLEDVGIQPNWDPRGWYRPIATRRFGRWGGPPGYLCFLRDKCGFVPLR